jgi:AcrR family transcriptional regulator
LRSIAGEAGVDPSLISHYFGDKGQLLVATLELPVNPIEKLNGVVAGGIDGMGERLLRTFLSAWDPNRDVFSAMVRTQFSGPPEQMPVPMIIRDVVAHTIADALEGEDRDLRASLIGAQLFGMAVARYVLQLQPLAETPIDDVAHLYGPSLQRLMDG